MRERAKENRKGEREREREREIERSIDRTKGVVGICTVVTRYETTEWEPVAANSMSSPPLSRHVLPLPTFFPFTYVPFVLTSCTESERVLPTDLEMERLQRVVGRRRRRRRRRERHIKG